MVDLRSDVPAVQRLQIDNGFFIALSEIGGLTLRQYDFERSPVCDNKPVLLCMEMDRGTRRDAMVSEIGRRNQAGCNEADEDDLSGRRTGQAAERKFR